MLRDTFVAVQNLAAMLRDAFVAVQNHVAMLRDTFVAIQRLAAILRHFFAENFCRPAIIAASFELCCKCLIIIDDC
jgi:hypothetical protein